MRKGLLWIAPILFLAGFHAQAAAEAVAPSAGVAFAVAPDSEPATAAEAPPASPVNPPAAVVIPRGTSLDVRVNETLSTKTNVAGDRFTATLIDPVVVGGRTVLPAGTMLTGHVVEASPSGRLKGRAHLALALDSFTHNGQRRAIQTAVVSEASKSHKGRNWFAIGGGSGVGAAIGAIAGGGAGALIGAGAGAAAGTAGAAATGKKELTVPAESVMQFTLAAPVRR